MNLHRRFVNFARQAPGGHNFSVGPLNFSKSTGQIDYYMLLPELDSSQEQQLKKEFGAYFPFFEEFSAFSTVQGTRISSE